MKNISIAQNLDEYQQANRLFQEYAAFLKVDLCFQNFHHELQNLPSMYGEEGRGCLLLAWQDGQAVGCVGVRLFDQKTCEMKRMYVQPHAQGQGIGHALVDRCLLKSRRLGYDVMRLDSVAWLEQAIAIYRKFGFEDCEPYRYNPDATAVFMQKQLADAVVPAC